MTTLAELPGPGGTPIRIRRAVPDDAAAALAYLRLVGAETDNLSFGAEGPPLDEAGERALLEDLSSRDNCYGVLAERRGEIVAMLTFVGERRRRFRHSGELGISVARAYWGYGIGRRLMQMLIDWARASGSVRKLNLIVRADNRPAIALYESLGFEIEGRIRREILIDGEFHDSLYMGLPIDG
jgi:RimJ/RimL family protein N-acetyltransferase